MVFELAFGVNELPQPNPKEEGISIDVLIDLDGYRKEFRVGYYIFPLSDGEGEWFTYDTEAVITKYMKWMDILPLSAKDK